MDRTPKVVAEKEQDMNTMSPTECREVLGVCLTPWFYASTSPVHKGLYQIHMHGNLPDSIWTLIWDGKVWRTNMGYRYMHDPHDKWRGLMKVQK